jgi:hypothetical protein
MYHPDANAAAAPATSPNRPIRAMVASVAKHTEAKSVTITSPTARPDSFAFMEESPTPTQVCLCTHYTPVGFIAHWTHAEVPKQVASTATGPSPRSVRRPQPRRSALLRLASFRHLPVAWICRCASAARPSGGDRGPYGGDDALGDRLPVVASVERAEVASEAHGGDGVLVDVVGDGSALL